MKPLRTPWKYFPSTLPSLGSLNYKGKIILSNLKATFYFEENEGLCRSKKKLFGVLLLLS